MAIDANREFEKARLILLHEWDPLFVTKRRDYNESVEDEYNGYAREICDILAKRESFDEILAYLQWAETQNMGLPFSESKARRAAELLLQGHLTA